MKAKPQSSVQNRILLLLLITAALNLIWVFRHDEVGRNNTMINAMKNDFRSVGLDNKPVNSQPTLAEDASKSSENERGGAHKVAGLSCQRYGGPPDEAAAEMVYWSDIPSDAIFVSPLKAFGPKIKYLTFEPDVGGFNNIRMAMETVVAMAHAMGRTLVLPPEQRMYLLARNDRGQKDTFTFADFFHFDSVANEQNGIDVISFEEFLQREAVTGNLRDKKTGQISYPPENQTAKEGEEVSPMLTWMRSVAPTPIWSYDDCVVGFPSQPGSEGDRFLQHLNTTVTTITKQTTADELVDSYRGHPTAVDAPPEQRIRELVAHRRRICFYDASLQQEKVVHMMADLSVNARLLVHFYAFLFFEDWRHDLWTKRFIRDHLRYVDEIQCAAARVVNALREKSRANGSGDGMFSALHIRRGDFQYETTRLEAPELYANSRDELVPNSTIYIATDERNKTFFDVFKEHYHVYYLDDFEHLLKGVNTNYFGMIDQRICSRAKTFVGTYYSSFTGYINRMRGYHSQLDKAEGYGWGKIESFYFVPEENRNIMTDYVPLFNPMWSMEFPVGWRDIDRGESVIPAVLKTRAKQ